MASRTLKVLQSAANPLAGGVLLLGVTDITLHVLASLRQAGGQGFRVRIFDSRPGQRFTAISKSFGRHHAEYKYGAPAPRDAFRSVGFTVVCRHEEPLPADYKNFIFPEDLILLFPDNSYAIRAAIEQAKEYRKRLEEEEDGEITCLP